MTGNAKLTAILLVAIVAASGVGYWIIAPKLSPVEISTYRMGQTSSISTSQQIELSSTASVETATAATQWIKITTIRPIGYYLSFRPVLQSSLPVH